MPRHAWMVLAASLLAAGCDKPPTKQIEAAEAQVEAARQQGAGKYAPARLKEAEEALKTARENVEDSDYRAALASANQAAERARSAVQAMAAARALARGQAQVAEAEVRAVLDELDVIAQEAAAAKVPEEAFADLTPRVQEVHEGLARLAATIEKDGLQGQSDAAELKSRSADLTTAFRQAQAKWLAEHRQGKRSGARRK